jgi:hypothetical protein
MPCFLAVPAPPPWIPVAPAPWRLTGALFSVLRACCVSEDAVCFVPKGRSGAPFSFFFSSRLRLPIIPTGAAAAPTN